MGKLKMLEVIIRGDIIEKNILLKLGELLRKTKLRVDFSASIVIPPFIKAVEKHYPSVSVLYVTTDLEDKFQFEKILKEFVLAEKCEIVSMYEF